MDRRHASKLILTGSLAAPVVIRPSSLLANPLKDLNESARIAEAARPVIRVAANRVVLEWFIVRTLNGWSAMNLQREFRQHNEKRASLGGLLGGLQRMTVDQRLKTAQVFGTIYLLNNAIFLLPLASVNPRAFEANLKKMEFHLYHQYLSWDLEAAFKLTQLGNRSAESIRQEAKEVGAAYLATAISIMLMINPVGRKNYRAGS